MIKPLSFNSYQATIALLQPKYNYSVAGRGVGKSSLLGHKMHDIVHILPGASAVIAAKTFTHVLTSILPSAFAHLERMGYHRDIHYVIGKRPPKEWGLPYNTPVKDFTNYLTFLNPERPVGFSLVSQERTGSGRGPNSDVLLTDETLRLDKEKLDNELGPTLRANKDKFKHIPWHLGQFHTTSMPVTREAMWILEMANYYMEEYGIDYLGLWRQVVKMQLDLLDIEDPEEFARQWNEIQIVRRKMKPRLSMDGTTLFTFSNAFDNLQNIGLSYIREQRKNLPEIIFLIEIMNMVLTMNDNCFYALKEDVHIYYDGWDDDITHNIALASNFDFKMLERRTSAMLSRRYYNPNLPLYLFMDWGGTISFALAAQFNKSTNTLYILKEFYVKPGDNMPVLLMGQFIDFFEDHAEKKIYYVRDSYGDNTSIQSSKTINQDAISALRKSKWKVIPKRHRHKEPPMFKKWQLMQKIMNEGDDRLFKIRIDGNNCKYLVIAMKDTKVKQVGNELKKDKTLERDKKADQRKATHSTDALDKGCYWLNEDKKSGIFVDVKV